MSYVNPKHNTENYKIHSLQLHSACILMSNRLSLKLTYSKKRLLVQRRNIKTDLTKRLDNRSKWRIYYVERFWSQVLKQYHKDNKISKTKLEIDNIKILSNIKAKLLILKELNNKYLQARTKYLRKTLVFVWNSALRQKFHFYFQGVVC